MWNEWSYSGQWGGKSKNVCMFFFVRPQIEPIMIQVWWDSLDLWTGNLVQSISTDLMSVTLVVWNPGPLRAFYWRKSPHTPLTKTKPLCWLLKKNTALSISRDITRTLTFMKYRIMMLFLSNVTMEKLVSGRLKSKVEKKKPIKV